MPNNLPEKDGFRPAIKTVTALVAFFVFFTFLLSSQAFALTNTFTSGADYSAGHYDGTTSETKEGDLQLESAGAWGPRVWRTSDYTLTVGTALASDGDYVYVLEGAGNYFSRYDPSSNTWANLADSMHTTYYGADLVVLGNYIYAIFGGYQREFSRYSIIDDSWTDMENLPDLTYRGASLSTDGTTIFATRGYNTTDFWKYDVSANTWSVAPSTPASLYYGASLEYNGGYLYTPRGYNRNTFYRYDISGESWSTMATAPGTFNGDGTGDVKDGYIYYLRNSNVKTFWRYNISGNSWDTLTDTPQNSRYVGVVYNSGDDQLYVFRGNSTYDFWKYDDSGDEFLGPSDLLATPGSGADLIYYNGYLYHPRGNNSTSFYRYNVSSDAWESRTAAPASFNDDTKGVLAGSLIYYFRGSNTTYFYSYSPAGNSWATLAEAPSTVRYGGALVYPGSGDYIYATRGNYSLNFWRYSISGDSWDVVSVTDIPNNGEAAYGARLTTDGTDIYYLSGARTGKVFKYVIGTDAWSEIGNTPYAPYWGTDVVHYNGNLYITAGYYKKDFWEYDISEDSWRLLDPVGSYYGYDLGAYNGASLATNGSGTIYHIRGNNTLNMNIYTVDSNAYLTSGTWTSDVQDLTYVSSWTSLTGTTTTPSDSAVSYETRSSADQLTWTSWQGLSGDEIQSTAQRYLQVRATLTASTDRASAPTLHSATVSYVGDGDDPDNPDTFTGSSQEIGGVSLTSGESYSYAQPYIDWSGAADSGSGISGYYVYYGTNASADPETLGSYQTASDFTVTAAMSAGSYYLRVNTKDVAGNVSSAVTGFTYVYSGVPTTSLTTTSASEFNTGTLTNVSSSGDQLKLSGKAGFWQEERLSSTPANMRMGSDAAYVSSTNKLYAFRGSNTTAFYEYDIDTDTWTTKAVAPATVYYGGALVEGPSGYLYGFRGYNTSTFWRYDIDDDEWSDAAATDAPQAIYFGGALVYDGSQYIYALRGNNDDSFLRYDTTADSWDSLTSADFGAVSNQVNNLVSRGGDLTFDGDNTIYAIQGNTRSGFAAYSIEDNEWTALPNTPALVYYGGRIEYDATANAVFFIPGWGKTFFYKYDLSTGEWERLTDGPLSFYYGTSMRSTDGELYITRANNSTYFYKYDTTKDSWLIPTRGLFGGLRRGTDYRQFYYGAEMVKGDGNYFYMLRGYYDNLFVRYDSTTGASVKMADSLANSYVGGTLGYDSTNNKIYASASQQDDSLYIYDIATDVWSEVTTDPFPVAPNSGSSLVYDGSQYMYWVRGGASSFYRYDTQGSAGSRWESLTNSPASLSYGAQLVHKSGYIYTMRGNNTTPNPLYRYDTAAGTWSSSLATLDGRIYNDGFLVDGDDYLYACRGANTDECWRYDISGDSWAVIEDSPAQIYLGGSAASDGAGKMLMIAGPGTSTFNDGLYTYVMQTDITSFEESGSYDSATHDLTAVYRWANLGVTHTPASNAGVSIYTRSSSDGSAWSAWSLVSEEKNVGTAYTYKMNSPVNRYIQTRFSMTSSDGVYSGTIADYTINYYQDTTLPTNPTTVSSYSDSGLGTAITTATWYAHSAPHFDWPDAEAVGGATDTSTGSGVIGYYVYFGTNALADPESLGELVAASEYTASSLTSGETYYLRIRTIDDAANVSSATWSPFTYKYDSTAPGLPSALAADPSGYSATDEFDFSWDAPTDAASGIDDYCYKTDAVSGDYSADQCTSSLGIDDVSSYQSGANTFYVRAKDNAGNYSSYATVSYYYSGDAPSPPQSLSVTPTTNTANSFAFTWDAPATYFGSEASLVYHYSINAFPTAQSTTETTETALDAGAFATLPGENRFYIVAEDEAGNIDYDVYSQVIFTANTTAPGIPTSVDIADVSVKATESWKIAVSWEAPADEGAGVSSYKIHRSEDGSSFTEVASTGGISYVDTGLEQVTYYYKVQACDNANNCGEISSEVNQYPDGKFVESAPLVGEPEVSSITTKKATIAWTTSRTCDSKVAFGTSSGDYNEEEVSNSVHVTAHALLLSNLSPGTTYYFVAKWTDEDGNTGVSDEYTFDTSPAPAAKEVVAAEVGLTTATIQFTSSDASSAKIYYGETTAFGGYSEINVSSTESTYTVKLVGLSDGTKYYYKVNLFDIEDEEYEGDTNSFETLPRPSITDVNLVQLNGLAKPTVLLTWKSNTGISSIVSYYPSNDPGAVKDVIDVELLTGKHRAIVGDLLPQTRYIFVVSGKDIAGNEARADEIIFSTAKDSRPPLVSDLKIEGSILRTGDGGNLAQLVVSWQTDELGTSQVEFGEGSGTTYSQKTQEDVNMTNNHLVVISNLTPSKVYHLRVVSMDDAGNVGNSVDSVTITPKATDAALDLVISNLSEVFGFVGNIGT
jgi:hypothetical protein